MEQARDSFTRAVRSYRATKLALLRKRLRRTIDVTEQAAGDVEHAVIEAKKTLQDATLRRQDMTQLHPLAVARTRQAARDELTAAVAALAEAEGQIDRECGIGINLTLQSRVRAAEKRVDSARAELRRIDPNSSE